MILGAGIFQVPAIRKAQEMGLTVIVCSNRQKDPGMSIAEKAYNISTIDQERVLDVCRREDIDGIMTLGSELSQKTVSFICDSMGLAGYSRKHSDIILNKYSLRNFLAENNIVQPGFSKAKSLTEAIDAYNLLGGKCIMKPLESSGSRGVFLVESKNDIITNFKSCLNMSIGEKGIVMEEYLVGEEVGGDCIVSGGKIRFFQMTNKYKNDFFVPTGHTLPSKKPEFVQKSVKKTIQKAVKSLDINRGPLNFDFILSENGPILLELGARIGGNCIPQIIELSTGFDTVTAIIRQSLRMPENFKKPKRGLFCGVRIFGGYIPGRIKYMTPPDEIRRFLGDRLVELVYDVGVGGHVKVFNQGAHRTGHAIFTSECMHQLDETMESLKSLYTMDIE